jgi:hypothetical protein
MKRVTPQNVTIPCPYLRGRVRFEVFKAVTVKDAVLWDIKTQFVSDRRRYVSATESNRLMLCKISGFHGGDCEECGLL